MQSWSFHATLWTKCMPWCDATMSLHCPGCRTSQTWRPMTIRSAVEGVSMVLHGAPWCSTKCPDAQMPRCPSLLEVFTHGCPRLVSCADRLTVLTSCFTLSQFVCMGAYSAMKHSLRVYRACSWYWRTQNDVTVTTVTTKGMPESAQVLSGRKKQNSKKWQLLCFEWSPPWHFKTACWHHFCLKLLSRDFCPTNYPNHLFHLAGHCACQSVKQDINMSVGHVK